MEIKEIEAKYVRYRTGSFQVGEGLWVAFDEDEKGPRISIMDAPPPLGVRVYVRDRTSITRLIDELHRIKYEVPEVA